MTAPVRLLAALGLAALLLATLASLQAPPLRAQAVDVNLVGFSSSSSSVVSNDGSFAQDVTTGSHQLGYIITSVALYTNGASGNRYDNTNLVIRANNSSNRPGDLLAELEKPASLAGNSTYKTFAATEPVRAQPDTTYWIVVNDGPGGNGVRPRRTANNNHTSDYGWTVGDVGLWKSNRTGGWSEQSNGNSLIVNVQGHERTASTDATLSDLTVRESTGATVSLTQSTVGGVQRYEGSVGDASSYITIEPETTYEHAEVEYLDASDNPLSDTQSSVDGFQVNLVEGERNEIRVRVVAEDQTTTQVYKLFVTRAAVPGEIVLNHPLVKVAGNGNFTSWVRLSKQPSADVEVTRPSSVDHIEVLGSPAMTFTPANWSGWQSFTLVVSAPATTNVAHTFTYTAASADSRFDGVQARQFFNWDGSSPPDYHLHRISPRTGLALGERDLPDESMSVYVDFPFYETMDVATEGFFWTPSGIWGDRDADTVWVVNPAHFGIHPLKLSALRQGRIERHVAEVPSNTTATQNDYRFSHVCHFDTANLPPFGNPALTVLWGDDDYIWVANDTAGLLQAFDRDGPGNTCFVKNITGWNSSGNPIFTTAGFKTPFARDDSEDKEFARSQPGLRKTVRSVWSDGSTMWLILRPGGSTRSRRPTRST